MQKAMNQGEWIFFRALIKAAEAVLSGQNPTNASAQTLGHAATKRPRLNRSHATIKCIDHTQLVNTNQTGTGDPRRHEVHIVVAREMNGHIQIR